MCSMEQRILYFIVQNPLRVSCQSHVSSYLNPVVCISNCQGHSPTQPQTREVNIDTLVLCNPQPQGVFSCY